MMPAKTIVLFGRTGSGKSAVVNLMAGRQIAKVSPDVGRCTSHWKEYSITFDGYNYKVFDTVGLDMEEQDITANINTIHLVAKLASEGGIDLLLFCVRAGTMTATTKANYQFIFEFLCEKKVPIALILTNLEKEHNMEDWWSRNDWVFQRYGIDVAGHACITAVCTIDGRYRELYEQSRRLVRDLVIQHTHGMREAGANESVEQKPSGSTLSTMTREDIETILTGRYRMQPKVARQLVSIIRPEFDKKRPKVLRFF